MSAFFSASGFGIGQTEDKHTRLTSLESSDIHMFTFGTFFLKFFFWLSHQEFNIFLDHECFRYFVLRMYIITKYCTIGGEIYSLSPHPGSANLYNLFIQENLEESHNKDKKYSQHFSHRSACFGQWRTWWHPDSQRVEIYSSLFHVFSTLGEGHCNVSEIYAVVNKIISSQ